MEHVSGSRGQVGKIVGLSPAARSGELAGRKGPKGSTYLRALDVSEGRVGCLVSILGFQKRVL